MLTGHDVLVEMPKTGVFGVFRDKGFECRSRGVMSSALAGALLVYAR